MEAKGAPRPQETAKEEVRVNPATSYFKAAMNGLGGFPAAIASRLSDIEQEESAREYDRALQKIVDRIRAMERRIVGPPDPEELAEILSSVYMVILRTRNEEKLAAAANIVANAFLPDCDREKIPFTELDHFAHALESLSLGSIQVLGHLFASMRPEEQMVPRRVHKRFSFQEISDKFEEHDHSLLMGLLGELDRFNLVLRTAGSIPDGYRHFEITLTPLGAVFCAYILGGPPA